MHYAYVLRFALVRHVLTLRLISLHHTKLPEYMKEMKKYHLAHHYKNFDLGFGVTCAFMSLRSLAYY
jgi:sterol desaturase/sphingolipid hydroxylase (fatty acid hydroxylase superfamily)